MSGVKLHNVKSIFLCNVLLVEGMAVRCTVLDGEKSNLLCLFVVACSQALCF